MLFLCLVLLISQVTKTDGISCVSPGYALHVPLADFNYTQFQLKLNEAETEDDTTECYVKITVEHHIHQILVIRFGNEHNTATTGRVQHSLDIGFSDSESIDDTHNIAVSQDLTTACANESGCDRQFNRARASACLDCRTETAAAAS